LEIPQAYCVAIADQANVEKPGILLPHPVPDEVLPAGLGDEEWNRPRKLPAQVGIMECVAHSQKVRAVVRVVMTDDDAADVAKVDLTLQAGHDSGARVHEHGG